MARKGVARERLLLLEIVSVTTQSGRHLAEGVPLQTPTSAGSPISTG